MAPERDLLEIDSFEEILSLCQPEALLCFQGGGGRCLLALWKWGCLDRPVALEAGAFRDLRLLSQFFPGLRCWLCL